MRIKRILSLALCLILVCLSLVGCDEEIGSYLKNYDYQPEKIANLDYDVYIIVGEGTEKNATTTVNAYISNYLSDKFKSRVNINYVTKSEYEATANEAVASSTVNKAYLSDINNNRVTAGKILLVTSEAMMDGFISSEKLFDLSSFVYSDEYKELFGKLKTQIPEHLMDAAKTEDGKLYAIPNNHIVGEYKYLVFNREAAQMLNYVDTEKSDLRAMTTLDDCGDLINYYYDKDTKTLYYKNTDGNFYLFNENGYEGATAINLPESAEKVVREVSGAYEDQMQYMKNGYVCNISELPTCTRAEAFESAFAIISETEVYYYNDANKNKKADDDEIAKAELVADKTEVAKRAMQIVNAINSDVELRNLLQYGVKGINYELKKDSNGRDIEGFIGSYITADQNTYYMYLGYTGDIFKAYYSENPNIPENLWTEEMFANGTNQNKKVNYYKDIYLKQ